jgi:hypothetical protein
LAQARRRNRDRSDRTAREQQKREDPTVTISGGSSEAGTGTLDCHPCSYTSLHGGSQMNSIIYIVGLVVIVAAVLGFLGFR